MRTHLTASKRRAIDSTYALVQNLTSLAGIKYALSEIQSILGSPIRAYQMRDKLSKRQHPSLATADSGGGGDMGQRGAGVTGGGQMGEHLSPSSLSYASSLDADTAVADDDIPGHVTRIMGKSECHTCVITLPHPW